MVRFGKTEIAALEDGDGAIVVDLAAFNATQPIPSTLGRIALGVDEGLSKGLTFGNGASVDLSLDAATSAEIVFVSAKSPQVSKDGLEDFGLAEFFTDPAHQGQLVAALRFGASASGGVDAMAPLNPALRVGATLKAGFDGALGYARTLDATIPAATVIADTLGRVRLPSMLTGPPEQDEVLYLKLGGRLSIGLALHVGYEIGGTQSIELGDIELAERVELGLIGKLAATAEVAGSFRVEVRPATEASWARVTVRKASERQFGVAADVAITAKNDVSGLPDAPNEFLESLLGLKAKNWLSLFEKLKGLTDLKEVARYADKLARTYIERFTGQEFASLTSAGWENVVAVAGIYQSLDTMAMEICQRYWDKANSTLSAEADEVLRQVAALGSIGQLSGRVFEGRFGEILYLLAGGDPLGVLAQESALALLQARARDALKVSNDPGLARIRKVLDLTATEFAFDDMVRKLEKVDAGDLQNGANQVLAGFIERLIGESIEGFSVSKVGKLLDEVRGLVNKVDEFSNTLYGKLKEVVNGAIEVGLHAGYNRNHTSEALIDVELKLDTPLGLELMRAAGMGRFDRVLNAYDPSVVRIHSGTLTNRFGRSTTVKIDVVGWKKGWRYQSIRQLLVESVQRLQPTGNGGLLVVTELKMGTSKERTTLLERRFTNFALGLLGASKGVVEFDEKTRRYFVDGIESTSASYEVVYEDKQTTPRELAQYLSFADTLGLAESDSDAWERLATTLPRTEGGGYGTTKVSYDVRLTEEGLSALLLGSLGEQALRRRMKLLVLVNYLARNSERHRNLGWAYWTPGMRAAADEPGFVASSKTNYGPIAPSPLRTVTEPDKVHLDPNTDKLILSTLYGVEDAVLDAFLDLRATLKAGRKLTLREYEKSLRSFGRALTLFDKYDASENSVFALLDAWIQASGGAKTVRNASLTLTCEANGKKVRKTLFA